MHQSFASPPGRSGLDDSGSRLLLIVENEMTTCDVDNGSNQCRKEYSGNKGIEPPERAGDHPVSGSRAQ